MKKILIIGGLVLSVATASWAVAPAPHNYSTVKATATVTRANVFGGTWLIIDSLILVASDSANVLISVSGFALGNPGGKIYFSLDNGTTTLTPLDTVIVEFPRVAERTGGMFRSSFAWARGKANNGALTDTLYLRAALGGSSQSDVVYLQDVALMASVEDQ